MLTTNKMSASDIRSFAEKYSQQLRQDSHSPFSPDEVADKGFSNKKSNVGLSGEGKKPSKKKKRSKKKKGEQNWDSEIRKQGVPQINLN